MAMRSIRNLTRTRQHWAVALAAASVPLLLQTPARAQFPVNNNGHVNDANNQVGSGGINQSSNVGRGVTQNDIIYGNVTGGRQFRGNLNETDARAFSGPTAGGPSDRFIADSNGAPVRGSPSAYALPTVQPFYGESRAVAPPPGFVPTVSGPGYVLPNTNLASTASAYNLSQRPLSQSVTGQTSGVLGTSPLLSNSVYSNVRGDQRVGTFNNSLDQGLLSVSPLSGIQSFQFNSTAFADQQLVPANSVDRFRATRSVAEMQAELLQNSTGNPNISPNQEQTGQMNNGKLGGPGSPRSSDEIGGGGLIPKPFESPENNRLGNAQALPTSAIESGQINSSDGTSTGQGLRLQLMTPAQQSTQYNELKTRLARYDALNRPQTDAEANNQFEKGVRARDAAKAATPGDLAPGTTPPGTTPPGTTTPGRAPGAPATPGSAVPGAAMPGAALPAERVPRRSRCRAPLRGRDRAACRMLARTSNPFTSRAWRQASARRGWPMCSRRPKCS